MHRVLIVDDDPQVRETLLEELSANFMVCDAESGEAGLKVIESETLDAVVSDVRMPGMGGIAFLEAAEKMDPRLVRVFLTGYGDEEVARAAVSTGAYKLRKPWGDELEIFLRSALRQRDHLQRTQRLWNEYVHNYGRPFGATAEDIIHRDRLATLGAMAATIAHDVRSPLWVLASNHSYVEDLAREQGIRDPDLLSIFEDNRTALRMIEEILDSTRTLTATPGKPEPVDMASVLRTAAKLLRPQLREKSVQIDLHIDGHPMARANVVEICQICVNLLMDAILVASRHTRLRADVRQLESRIELSLRSENATSEGEATPLSTFQLDKSQGVGISIAKELARKHSGDLVVSLGPIGMEIRLSLPAEV